MYNARNTAIYIYLGEDEYSEYNRPGMYYLHSTYNSNQFLLNRTSRFLTKKVLHPGADVPLFQSLVQCTLGCCKNSPHRHSPIVLSIIL